MRFLPLALLSLLLGTGVRAQILTVSDEMVMRSDTDYHLVGKLGGNTLLLQDRDTKFLLNGYDRNMQQNWEKELELQGRNIRLLTTVAKQDGTGFHLVYIYRKQGDFHLQLDLLNPAGNIQDTTKLLTFGGFMNYPEDEFVLSEDETKLLLMIPENQTKVRCVGIDLAEQELLFDRTLDPERFFFGEDFLQAEMTNDGTMYFIIERDNFRSKRKEHHYEIHRVEPEGETVNFDVNMGDSLTYDLFFRYDNLNRQLVGGGLYAIRDFVRADGYFWTKVDDDQPQQSEVVFTPFPLPLVKNVEGKKYNKKNPGINELSVRDVILRRDGGGLLICERNRQLERRSSASRYQATSDLVFRPLVDFHYDELLVFSVDPAGAPQWNNILHKKQYSQDDGGAYSSYLLLETPRSLRFLFNDEIRFENTVSEYVVNARGEFDRNSLFNTRDLNLRLRFRDGVQVAGNEVILPSEHRNKLRLVKMTYESR